MIRGRLSEPSKNERLFWEENQPLLLDDSEVPYNNLITLLRNIAIEYWETKEVTNEI